MTVVVAQLTDTHLCGPGKLNKGTDTRRALDDAVAAIGKLPVAVDAVLVTGDLAEHGLADEYACARDCLKPIGAPIYVVPGNHDDRAILAATLPDRLERAPAGEITYIAEVGSLRVVMLDTTVPGADHGSLEKDRLDWLDRELSARPSQPTLIAMHHPPIRTGIPQMDAINLREGEILEALLEKHDQVISLFCGHVHRSIFKPFAGRIASIGPSPAFAVRLDLCDAGEIRLAAEAPGLHLHIWSPDSEPFGSVTTHRVQISSAARTLPL